MEKRLRVIDGVNYPGSIADFIAKMNEKLNGRRTIIPVMTMKQKGSDLRFMRFTSPAEVKGVSFLVKSEEEMYLYMPEFGKIRRIAWGTADRFNPTDNLNPDDISDFFDFGQKVPSWAARADIYAIGDQLKFTGVWLPGPVPILLPRFASVPLQSPLQQEMQGVVPSEIEISLFRVGWRSLTSFEMTDQVNVITVFSPSSLHRLWRPWYDRDRDPSGACPARLQRAHIKLPRSDTRQRFLLYKNVLGYLKFSQAR